MTDMFCKSQPTITKQNTKIMGLPGESDRDWVRGEYPKELDNLSRIVEERMSFENRVEVMNLAVVA